MASSVKTLRVKIAHGDLRHDANTLTGFVELSVNADGSDTIEDIKKKIAATTSDAITYDQLLLEFGPNETKYGKTFYDDPAHDETALTLGDYSALHWIEKFPHWYLLARLIPPAPPIPGYAAHRAAALGKNEDPDKAIEAAIQKGELLKMEDYPAPWGKAPKQPSLPKIFEPIADPDEDGRVSGPSSFGLGGEGSFIKTAGAMAPDGKRLGYSDITSTPTPMKAGALETPYDNVAGRKQ
ncbi:hypothetical protein RI054_28g116840 [Pseudoscourfieldia marina]